MKVCLSHYFFSPTPMTWRHVFNTAVGLMLPWSQDQCSTLSLFLISGWLCLITGSSATCSGFRILLVPGVLVTFQVRVCFCSHYGVWTTNGRSTYSILE